MKDFINTTLAERAEKRRARLVVHRSYSYDEAEKWDLEYWQSVTPRQRLEAYMAIRSDVEIVVASRTPDVAAAAEKLEKSE